MSNFEAKIYSTFRPSRKITKKEFLTLPEDQRFYRKKKRSDAKGYFKYLPAVQHPTITKLRKTLKKQKFKYVETVEFINGEMYNVFRAAK